LTKAVHVPIFLQTDIAPQVVCSQRLTALRMMCNKSPVRLFLEKNREFLALNCSRSPIAAVADCARTPLVAQASTDSNVGKIAWHPQTPRHTT
jgi:hypothetical protein